jgi:hypothetical protein
MLDCDEGELSDVEAGLACVLGDCPPGALLNADVPCALWHALYAVIHHSTEVDVELERLRHGHAVRVLRLPAQGDERVLLRAEDYARAMRTSGLAGADRVAEHALPRCTGVTCTRAELLAALQDAEDDGVDGRPSRQQGADAIERLRAAGWLVPRPQASHAVAVDEAPGGEGADEWLWGMPLAGRLLYTLSKARAAVLALLHKHKHGRALRVVLERAPALCKLLTQSRLDLRFVLRDLVGKRLLRSTDTRAGVVLDLTPAGFQAAAAAAPRGKKRGR